MLEVVGAELVVFREEDEFAGREDSVYGGEELAVVSFCLWHSGVGGDFAFFPKEESLSAIERVHICLMEIVGKPGAKGFEVEEEMVEDGESFDFVSGDLAERDGVGCGGKETGLVDVQSDTCDGAV